MTTTLAAYIKRVHRDLKREFIDIIYYGELQIEKMNMNKIEDIYKACDSWSTYKENIASEKSS
jgi:hypothetical protein